jgi:hypothetical protein
MNIFGARKLLGRGELYITDKNLVVNKKGIPMFRFDENMMIIEASPRAYAFLATTHKDEKHAPHSIRLWHRRFGHLGLANVQKTSKMVRGMAISDEEDLTPQEQEDEAL